MKTTRVPEHRCVCGCLQDAASHNEDITPNAGDITLCLECGEITVFSEDFSRRAITEAEIAEIKQDEQGWRKIEHTQVLIRMKRFKEKK